MNSIIYDGSCSDKPVVKLLNESYNVNTFLFTDDQHNLKFTNFIHTNKNLVVITSLDQEDEDTKRIAKVNGAYYLNLKAKNDKNFKALKHQLDLIKLSSVDALIHPSFIPFTNDSEIIFGKFKSPDKSLIIHYSNRSSEKHLL